MGGINDINESKIRKAMTLIGVLNDLLYSILHRLDNIIAVLQELKFGDVEKLIAHYHSLISDIYGLMSIKWTRESESKLPFSLVWGKPQLCE